MTVPPASPPRTPRWDRRVGPPAWVIIGIVLVTGVLGTAAVAGVQWVRHTVSPSGSWQSGDCLHRQADSGEKPSYQPTSCDGPDADAKVLRTLPGSFAPKADCPAETDEIAHGAEDPSAQACVRRTAAPHPGDAGRGGGVLRAGDCWSKSAHREVACSTHGWYGKAVARVAQPKQCPAGTTFDAARITATSTHPWLCFGTGGQVLAAGACIRSPGGPANHDRRPSRVRCHGGHAWARVTGVADTTGGCKKTSANHVVPAPTTYKRFLCVRTITARSN